MEILVCGEALVNLVPPADGGGAAISVPGGSPFNVAVGLARLGVNTGFLGKISTDSHGAMLRTRLQENGVDVRFVVDTPRSTTTAAVSFRDGTEPEYVFTIEGSADRSLLTAEIPESLSSEVRAVHFGSYSLVLEPTASALNALMRVAASDRVVSLDPNVRPLLISSQEGYRKSFDRWCGLSDIVKLSVADAAFIAPSRSATDLAQDALERGASLVVVTRGAGGADAYTKRHKTEASGEPVDVVDTVGAGDAFTSGLLASLHEMGALQKGSIEMLDASTVEAALHFAVHASAYTCGRAGADPPDQEML